MEIYCDGDRYMITLCTLQAGRFYALEAYSWGLSIINYPKDQIHLLFLTNSDNDDFIHLMGRRVENLKGYASIRFIKTDIVKPSSNAFIENGTHTNQHAETIAKLYNEAYKYIETEDFLFLEDDIIAPSNAISGLQKCYEQENVGYACGTQMNRHGGVNATLFIWDLAYKRIFPAGDSCNDKTYQAVDIRKPWGIREIGLGHFGLTMLKKSICDKLPKPVFKPFSQDGNLKGCDMVLCIELEKLGYKKMANFDVRGLHMDSLGRIH